MATILIWMSPEPGHVLPTIKIARDLSARGHHVVYQSRDEMRLELEALGFQTVSFFESDSNATSSLYKACGSASTFYKSVYDRFPSRSAYIEAFRAEILNAATSVNADLVLIDGIFDGALRLNMHRVLSKHSPMARIYTHLPYSRIPEEEMSIDQGTPIFLSPRHFELQQLLYRQAFYTEPSGFMGQDFPEFPWSWIDRNRHLIYCSFGSQCERYGDILPILRNVVEAAKLTHRCQFVVNAGIFAKQIGTDSADNVLILDRVPQVLILKMSAVMILHGGFGSIKDCVYHRVPMLIIPQQWDQPANAHRVVTHGLGLSMRHSTPADIALATAKLISEESFAANLAAMQEVFLSADQQQPTAKICEHLLSG